MRDDWNDDVTEFELTVDGEVRTLRTTDAGGRVMTIAYTADIANRTLTILSANWE